MFYPNAQSILADSSRPMLLRAGEFVTFVILAPALLLGLIWLPLKTSGLGTSADFIQFYGVGRIIRAGHAANIYDYESQAAAQREFTTNTVPMIFNHPPFEALLFVPLAGLSYPAAFAVWSYLSLATLGLVFFLLKGYGRTFSLAERLILLGGAMIPAIACLMQGQDSFLILLSYTLAFLCLKSEQDFQGGFVLALGLIKPQLVIPFVIVLLLKRNYKFVTGFCCGGGVLLVVSFMVFGPLAVVSYAKMISQMGGISGRDAFHIYPAAMPNLRGFFYFLLNAKVSAFTISALTIVSSAVLLMWLIARTRDLAMRATEKFDADFSAIVLFTLLVSYHLLIHDLSLLILPAFLLLIGSTADAWQAGPILLAALGVEEFAVTSAGFKWYGVLLPTILVLALVIRRPSNSREVAAGA
jgi:hypothetical protein